MAKRTLYFLFTLLLPLSLLAAQPTANFAAANQLYAKGNYSQAAQAYNQLLAQGYQSAALYYNLGNAYYKQGQIAPALLNYQKARKLWPADADINFNIQFVNQKTTDRVDEVPPFFLTKWWHGYLLLLSAQTLAVLSVIWLLLGFALLSVYLLAQTVAIKKYSFYVALALLLLGFGAVFTAGRQQAYFNSHKQAIVFAGAATAKSAPDASAKNLFVIHEGALVNVLENDNDWLKIQLPNGSEGWIKQTEARQI